MAFTTTKRELYGGRIELVFNPRARNRYLVNDRVNNCTIYPAGVTTILGKTLHKDLMGWAVSESLKAIGGKLKFEKQEFIWYLDEPVTVDQEKLRWASKAYTRRSDEGKNFGSYTHEAIEDLLRSQDTYAPEECLPAIVAFIAWWNAQEDVEIIKIEEPVYSVKGNYSGTYDLLLKLDGKVVLCDIKTTKSGIYPENYIQLGAYSSAVSEIDAVTVDDLMIIGIPKTGVLETLRASELNLTVPICEKTWRAVLEVYRFMQPLKQLMKERRG